jgi:hypothetical protein
MGGREEGRLHFVEKYPVSLSQELPCGLTAGKASTDDDYGFIGSHNKEYTPSLSSLPRGEGKRKNLSSLPPGEGKRVNLTSLPRGAGK